MSYTGRFVNKKRMDDSSVRLFQKSRTGSINQKGLRCGNLTQEGRPILSPSVSK